MKTQRQPVQFDRPPVMEVACGLAFTLQKPLKSAHIGLYWARVRDTFPRCEDAPPIPMVVEGPPGADSAGYNLQFEMTSMPELRRAWLLNAAGTSLLQLQGDRFVYNWKRVGEDTVYPSYSQVIAEFCGQWTQYTSFLVEQGLGEPSPTQLELTYFNILPAEPSNLLRDHQRSRADDRFLGEPEAVNWRTQYVLPDGAGRLHVSATSARHVSGAKGIRLDFTARGLPKDVSAQGCRHWFDLAHEWITHGFADSTTPEAHRIWGRTA